MATRVKPIPLRLNPAIEFEAALRVQYDARPRARRQEFLRQILRLGWDAWLQGLAPGAAATTPRAVSTAASQVAVAPASPARAPASAFVAESVGESSKSLRGFFGEAQE